VGHLTPLLNLVSQALEPAEREAVCGDLSERRINGPRTLFELIGLIARRQATLWQNGTSWLLFVVVAVPLAVLLCLTSGEVSFWTSMDAWFYLTNWTPGYFEQGFRGDLVKAVSELLISWLKLVCWAWTSGLILGLMLRRAVWLGALLFIFVLLSLTELIILKHWMANSAVSSVAFYRNAMPFLILLSLVFVPALRGIVSANHLPAIPGRLRTLMFACITATTIALFASMTFRRPGSAWLYLALSLLTPLLWHLFIRHDTTKTLTRNPA